MNARYYMLISILALLCNVESFAQTYLINGGSNGTTINTCQGTINDSGGAGGDYSNSEFYTVTFCSFNGSQLILDVTQFEIENFFDDLFIYDGPNAGSPLIAQGTGNELQGQNYTSTGACVTLVFDTDGSVTDPGFSIDISCAFPCQAIEPQISFDPLLNLGPDDEILACTGSQVTFNGSAIFPENNDTYAQSIATSTFDWFVNGSLAFTGLDFNFEPVLSGQYIVELQVTDLEGCSSSIAVTQALIIIAEGSFSGTTIDVPPICVGEVVDLSGTYANEPVVIEVEQENDIDPGNPLFFPGPVTQHSSDLTVSGFPLGQTITDIDQIDAICIVMEHSYVGDLDITVICPNGTQVLLLDDEFGGNDLGTTNNGFEYCFSPDAPPGNVLDYQGINPIPAGEYASFEPMDALVGCDINGTWEIIVNDNLFLDDGFLFDWYIQFDEDFVGNQNAIPETVLSSQWLPDPSIIVDNGDQISVQPAIAGQQCYTYEVTTEFCTHDTTICFDVEDGTLIVFDSVDVLCAGQAPVQLNATPAGGIWSGAAAIDGTFDPSTAGTFWVVYESIPGAGECASMDSIEVTVDLAPMAMISGGGIICNGSDATITLSVDVADDWTVVYAIDGVDQGPVVFTGTSIDFDTGVEGSYTLISASNAVCDASVSGTVDVIIEPGPEVTISGDETICPGGSAEFSVDFEGTGPYTFEYAIDGVGQGSITTSDDPYLLTATQEGNYTVISFTTQNCIGITAGDADLNLFTAGTATLSGDASLCAGELTGIQIDFTGDAPYTFEYAINGLGQGVINTNDDPYIFDTAAEGDYTLLSFNDAACTGITAGSAQVDVLPAPTAIISGGGVICPSTTTDITVDFTGTGPFDFQYLINGVSQGFVNTALNPFILNTDIEGEYTLSDLSDANCTGTTAGTTTIEVLDEPVATINGGGSICDGEVATIEIDMEGPGPYTFEYAIEGLGQGEIISGDDPYVFETSTLGSYTLLSFSTSSCDGAVNGFVMVEATPIPEAVISGGGGICLGDEVDLQVTFDGSGPYTFEYALDGVSQGSVTTGDDAYTFSASELGIYTILAFSNLNCTGQGIGQAIVDESPPPTALFAQTETSVCPNEDSSVIIALGGAGPWTLEWTIDGIPQAGIITSASPYALDIEDAGTYIIETVSTGNCSGPGGNSLDVTLLELPTALLSGQDIVCPGFLGQLDLDFGGTGPWEIEYSIDGITSGTETFTDTISIWAVNEEGNYTMTSVSDANCSNTANGIGQLALYDLPDASFLNTEATICSGESVVFPVNFSGAAPFTLSYALDGLPQADIFTADGQAFLTFSESGTYSLENISDANCSSDPNSIAQLDFYPSLSASIDGPFLFCVGDTIDLFADVQGGNGQAQTFLWTDGFGESFNTSSLDYGIDSMQTFTLTVNDGCGVPFTTGEILFTGQEYPQPEVQAELDSVCAGSPVSFTHLDEIDPVSCLWTFSDGSVVVGCNTIEQIFENPGAISLSLTSSTSAGCATTLVIDTVVDVLQVPQAAFEFIADPGHIYAPTVQFLNLSSDAVEYEWDFGDERYSEEVEPRHDFPGGEAADYIVCLDARNDLGCIDSTCKMVSIESIFTVHTPNAFTPDGDLVNDCFAPVINDVELAEYEFIVFDPWGEQVFQSFDRSECWNGKGAQAEDYYSRSSVYSYRLLVRAADSSEKQEFKGMVVLVR